MKRLTPITMVLLVIALAVVGCGAAEAPRSSDSGATLATGAGAPYPTVAAAPARPATADESLKVALPTKGGADSNMAAPDRLIIRNGSLTIIVSDVADTISRVTAIAASVDGYVQSTSSRDQGGLLVATVTIKLPADRFDAVLADIKKLAVKVDVETSTSQDVTEEYVDLDARLKVYEATEQQLLTFLQKTQNVDESLKVFRELNTVRAQIESAKGRMNYLAKSAAMSTVTLTIKEQAKEKPIVKEEDWDPGKVVRDTLRWLTAALRFLFQSLVFIVFGAVPVALIVGVPLLALRKFWRRLRQALKKQPRGS